MSRVAFVDLSNNFYDKAAISYLSAYLKNKGIEVSYINERSFIGTMKRIKELRPKLLLYSAFQNEVPAYVAFDQFLKKHMDTESIIGGSGPTYDWGLVNRCTIDAVCVGEGEYALEEFLLSDSLRARNIICQGEKEPLGFHPLIADLDALPFPDRDIVYEQDPLLKNLNYRMFFSGRGCPFSCTYCFNNIYNRMFKGCGNIVRKKSVGYLIEEIKQCKGRYLTNVVVFQDDTFIYDKKWLQEFCDRFPREVNLPFTCNIRANLIDEETVKILRQANCIGVNWSIESGQEKIRNGILKRNISNEEILVTGRLLNKYGIRHRIGNMLGLPGEKYADMLETLKLNIKVKPYLGLANIFTPFPNLELTNYALDNGYLHMGAIGKISKNFMTRSVLNYTDEDNLNIQKLLFLFPFLVNYPVFFDNHYLRKFIFGLPRFMLKYLYALMDMLKMTRLYNVRVGFKEKFYMIWRYLWNL